ncbi:ICC-like phosphoesterase [Halorhabdus sp. SVX81]|uniref:metallophosphoesterase n=1 Tax=Halorhabdus sp. SVX81 TaxID=2978283 RepID=UPI0023D97C8B|nr:metallophosphoesterase [Halorhabdus sp. SVX81]WEL18632.1 ICC-like phosphoesterase [Halorhabdus sp. SVX81]
MLAVFADTHGTDEPRLAGRTADALTSADQVLHAGDFTTRAVYEAFERRANQLAAVHGNSDTTAVQKQLPAVRTLEWNDWRVLLVHGHEHTPTSLPLLARERDADLVVIGHTHRPAIERLGDLPVLNPGSHADPRAGPPTHAEVHPANGAILIELRERDGTVIDRVRVAGK